MLPAGVSAFFLYGIAFIYRVTGSAARVVSTELRAAAPLMLSLLGVSLLAKVRVQGLCRAVHMWTPDA